MNYYLRLRWSVLVIALFALSLNNSASAQTTNFKPYTVRLPAVDKIELLLLKDGGEEWNGEVAETKVVTGRAATNIARVWRTQNYYGGMAACHAPNFAIKFYRGEKLIAFATVCWACNNIGFRTPTLSQTQSFDGRSPKGQSLLKIFTDAFPSMKDNPAIYGN